MSKLTIKGNAPRKQASRLRYVTQVWDCVRRNGGLSILSDITITYPIRFRIQMYADMYAMHRQTIYTQLSAYLVLPVEDIEAYLEGYADADDGTTLNYITCIFEGISIDLPQNIVKVHEKLCSLQIPLDIANCRGE